MNQGSTRLDISIGHFCHKRVICSRNPRGLHADFAWSTCVYSLSCVHLLLPYLVFPFVIISWRHEYSDDATQLRCGVV